MAPDPAPTTTHRFTLTTVERRSVSRDAAGNILGLDRRGDLPAVQLDNGRVVALEDLEADHVFVVRDDASQATGQRFTGWIEAYNYAMRRHTLDGIPMPEILAVGKDEPLEVVEEGADDQTEGDDGQELPDAD